MTNDNRYKKKKNHNKIIKSLKEKDKKNLSCMLLMVIKIFICNSCITVWYIIIHT